MYSALIFRKLASPSVTWLSATLCAMQGMDWLTFKENGSILWEFIEIQIYTANSGRDAGFFFFWLDGLPTCFRTPFSYW